MRVPALPEDRSPRRLPPSTQACLLWLTGWSRGLIGWMPRWLNPWGVYLSRATKRPRSRSPRVNCSRFSPSRDQWNQNWPFFTSHPRVACFSAIRGERLRFELLVLFSFVFGEWLRCSLGRATFLRSLPLLLLPCCLWGRNQASSSRVDGECAVYWLERALVVCLVQQLALREI